jgi:micrococcal nuclease
VKRVIDGDTIVVDVDLGFSTVLHDEIVRLLDIDTPETRTRNEEEKTRGLAAKAFVQSVLPEGKEVILNTHKDVKGKYGRYLGHVVYRDDEGFEHDLVKELKERGHVK